MGANIANISLVAGLSAWVVGKVNVHGQFLRRDVTIALIAGTLPLILIFDGQLGRTDGLILIAIYGAYASSFFKHRFLQIAEEHKKGSYIQRFLRKFTQIDGNKSKEAARLFVGVAMLLVSANIIVRIARVLAEAAGRGGNDIGKDGVAGVWQSSVCHPLAFGTVAVGMGSQMAFKLGDIFGG